MFQKPVQAVKRLTYGLLSSILFLSSSASPALAQYWTANGSDIYNSNSGNVGIGISVPTEKLSIMGTYPNILQTVPYAANSAQLRMVNTVNAKELALGLVGSAGTLTAGSAMGDGVLKAQNNLRFSTDGGTTTPMTLDSSGKLGIGTTSPGARVDVSNTYTSATAGEQFTERIRSYFQTADTGLKQGLRLDTNATHTTGAVVDLYGILSLAANQSSGNVTSAMGLGSRIDNTGTGTITNGFGLRVFNSAGSGPLTSQYGVFIDQLTRGTSNNFAIYTSGTTKSSFGGRVGIGTSNPSYLLDVQGGTGIVGQFSGRVKGANAVNNDEFATLGQVSSAANGWTRNASNGIIHTTTITDSVGIGTGSAIPLTNKLFISGGTSNPSVRQVTNNPNAEIHLHMQNLGYNPPFGRELFLGLVGTGGQLVSGSLPGDAVLRNTGPIRFSTDGGVTTSFSASGNILNVNTLTTSGTNYLVMSGNDFYGVGTSGFKISAGDTGSNTAMAIDRFGSVNLSGGQTAGQNAGVYTSVSISSPGWYEGQVTFPSLANKPNTNYSVTLTHDNNGSGDMYVDKIRIRKGQKTVSYFIFQFYVSQVDTTGTTLFNWQVF